MLGTATTLHRSTGNLTWQSKSIMCTSRQTSSCGIKNRLLRFWPNTKLLGAPVLILSTDRGHIWHAIVDPRCILPRQILPRLHSRIRGAKTAIVTKFFSSGLQYQTSSPIEARFGIRARVDARCTIPCQILPRLVYCVALNSETPQIRPNYQLIIII